MKEIYESKFSLKALGSTLVMLTLIFCANAARAATITVTNTNDSGAGSLRQAIISAAPGDTIVFDANVFASSQTINLTSGELSIGKNLTITGTGARRLAVRRAAGSPTNFRIFSVTSGVVIISGLTFSDGNETASGSGFINFAGTVTLNGITASGNSNATAAIRNSAGTLTILNSTITNNLNNSGVGGVSVSGGTVNIVNSTISGNSASGVGGIGVSSGATLNMNNVTVTNNSTPSTNTAFAAGVSVISGGAVNLRNSIIGNNTAPGSVSPDVNGAFISNGNNLVGSTTGSTGFSAGLNDKLNVSANLLALANNGGQTDTHRANAGSPAIDAGNACVVAATCPTNNPPVALANDQRGAGFARQHGAGVDIGAIESTPSTAAGMMIAGRVLTSAGGGISRARVTLTDSSGNSRTVLTSTFGYYGFEAVEAGGVVTISVAAKGYSFVPQVLLIIDNLAEVNFTAQY